MVLVFRLFCGAFKGVWLESFSCCRFFEGEAYGGIFGALILLNGFGGASGAWLGGFIHDQVGSYVPVIIMIAFALFACLNIWRAAPRKIRAVPRGVH
jgi:predicted MFS family arabinose efflux permease